jgi:hypothetical protein
LPDDVTAYRDGSSVDYRHNTFVTEGIGYLLGHITAIGEVQLVRGDKFIYGVSYGDYGNKGDDATQDRGGTKKPAKRDKRSGNEPGISVSDRYERVQ